ncbi:threonylcarbamoyl-AMP synthase [Amylibacter kogurei]|uniref:Threonylcarbamoyl-AMP synthase n=1 Tax=Paramylibacter kogurei TaxID=1889778 RepID=A0A2G5KAD1_9RHOB|nr:L-threonylcarbamoyladenylate synthase [Amylibacter kogurei]PIB26129.1 threonylcarbamoyl-AMP synthase [Amylibacter kogurei]
MTNLDTQFFVADDDTIQKSAQILANGGVVAFPTETVYGLGADACNDRAVAKVFAAKGRPSFNPLIIHLANVKDVSKYAIMNEQAKSLAASFWPGPLSMVLPLCKNSPLSDLVTAGLDTVAIRIPKHPVGHALIQTFGGAIAAPSANPSGRISPTKASHVIDGLDQKIDAVLDGGDCQVGLESTIVMPLDDGNVALLRAGGVSIESIEAVIKQPLQHAEQPDVPQSPGQLLSHYAPNAHLRMNVDKPLKNHAHLGFGNVDCDLNLSPQGDLIEAAANLFSMLREIDDFAAQNAHVGISVAPIPEHGLGLAINDRLKRAAAPRD